MGEEDIRWHQRFNNYMKALDKLDEAVKKIREEYDDGSQGDLGGNAFLDDILKEALIKRFEYTFELSWNVMKDYFLYQGNDTIKGSRDAIREAFANNLISEGELWMDMIKSRVQTAHTYNEMTADNIYTKIMDSYHEAFVRFGETMQQLRNTENSKP